MGEVAGKLAGLGGADRVEAMSILEAASLDGAVRAAEAVRGAPWARTGGYRLALRAARGRRAFLVELGLAVVGAVIYFLVRGAVVDRVGEARANADAIMAIERTLGLFWEGTMQQWVLSSQVTMELMTGIYFWGHMPVIMVVAVGLFWRKRGVYRLTRNAFVVSAAVALVLYATLPVAPPRVFGEVGCVDTLALSGGAS